ARARAETRRARRAIEYSRPPTQGGGVVIWLINSVREAGWFGYLGICMGVVGLPLGLASLGSLFAKRRGLPLGLGAVTVLFALLTLALGVVGYFVAMHEVETALLGL